jgi:hypothetical protein
MSNKTTNYNLTKPTADDFYDVDVPNGNMDIIDAELKKLEDGKAPSGHGLGDRPEPYHYDSIKSVMQHGSGFYQVDSASDNPTLTSTWKPMIQLATTGGDGLTSGVQVVMPCHDVAEPKMFLRAIKADTSGNWVEMIHTGNYANLIPYTKLATGYYAGTGVATKTNPIKLSFDFTPKIFFLKGILAIPYGETETEFIRSNGTSGIIYVKWENKSVSLYFAKSSGRPSHMDVEGNVYYYAVVG